MQKLSEKLNSLIRKHRITKNELAQQVGVSKQVVSSLCHGKVKHSKALYPIAKYFGVNYNWLISNDDPNLATHTNQDNDDILVLDRFKKIPLLTTRLLGKEMLVENKLILDNITEDYELTDDVSYQHLFALTSTNNSLKFRFGSNSTLIFHSNLELISGDFVIAYLPDKELFVYRDLHIENNKRILVPVDQDIYKPIMLKNNDQIVAVLYEQRIKRRLPQQITE